MEVKSTRYSTTLHSKKDFPLDIRKEALLFSEIEGFVINRFHCHSEKRFETKDFVPNFLYQPFRMCLKKDPHTELFPENSLKDHTSIIKVFLQSVYYNEKLHYFYRRYFLPNLIDYPRYITKIKMSSWPK